MDHSAHAPHIQNTLLPLKPEMQLFGFRIPEKGAETTIKGAAILGQNKRGKP
jgi:hypothetical protein